ncbi:MAG: SDR family oxidoreductase [Kiloniellaceae bacterium]
MKRVRINETWYKALDMDNEVNGKPYAVIFGAASLVGPYLLRRLAERGFSGLCISRGAAPASCDTPASFSWATVSAQEGLRVPPAATLFSLVPITALPPLIARTDGGNRLIALSTSSALYKAESPDLAEHRLAQDVLRAEQEVQRFCRDQGIAWTIFRPTLVYDPGHDRNISAVAAFVRRFGVFPVVWPGTGRRQPVHADDVARAMVAALNAPGARDALFDLPGGETLTYREMVRRIFQSLGRRPVLLYLPLGLARMGFYVWQRVTGAKYSVMSLERMNTDLTLDPAPVRDALGITCRPFRPEFPEQADARWHRRAH